MQRGGRVRSEDIPMIESAGHRTRELLMLFFAWQLPERREREDPWRERIDDAGP